MSWLARVFTINMHDYLFGKPQQKMRFNKKALAHCIEYLDNLIAVVQKECAGYEIKNTSIFIVVDHIKEECKIKLIDFCNVYRYNDETKRDEGFIWGL